ncbi:uncharacterized protein LOC116163752 isoform X1 [Photinus pyralis]|nr:uncharacterized protein LOC116163752 isoform X1 [Photinus pyralis]
MVSNLLGKMMGAPAVEKEDAEQLKRLHDTIRGCLEAINNLGTDTASWDTIVIKIVSDKWDVETNKLFEQSLKQPSQIPKLEEVMEFLKLRFQSLEASEQRPKQFQEQSTSKSRWQPTSAITCYYCKQHHSMERCPKFQTLAAPQKMKIVREQQLCIRCMKHHQQYKCYSTINCATCSRPHHTMLHTPYNGTSTQATRPAKSASHAVTRSGQMETKRQDHQVLLATAMVRVQDIMGDQQVLRVLVDPGSQASFITEQAAQELKLPRTKITAMVSGLGNNEPKTARSQVMVHLQPRHSSKYMLTTELIVLPKITENLPRQSFKMEMESWQNVVLADPTLNIPGPIDILLGAHDYAKIIMEGIKKTESELLGQQTQFGWVISGQITYPAKKGRPVLGMVSVINEDKQLAKFWELEEVDVPIRQSEEDQWCEDHYVATTTRGPDGRYTVRIPFKEEPKEMAKSRPLVATRAIHLEVVSDMTTEAFIAALKRFTARRGRCQHIYSDNGTNFVGASKILEQVQPIVQGKDVQEESTSIGTQWHFIPPASPHIGGIWESGVKSLKYHLRRVIGEATLTYEELATLTQQIEACLNSRPLINTGEVVDDSMLLTPAHFLIGKPILEPFEETGDNNVNLPSSMEILAHPIKRTMVQRNDTHIRVFGVFVVAEITEYVIMKITPIPLKMEDSTVWELSTDNNIISVDYNNQLYFELTDEEFKNSIKIEKHKFLCAPTVVKKMEDSPNCIIREIYNHTENSNCNIQQHTITSTIWKQLYMENTWMFITKQPTRVAIICNGRRQEVMLNNTGIINLSQDCRLQTRQSILNPRRDKSIMVLGSYIKHVNISTQHTKRHPHHVHPLEEPVVKAGEQLNQLRDKEQELQNHIRETAWQKVTTHSMMTSTLTTIIIITASLAIGGGYIWYKRRQQPSRQTTEDIKMEPIIYAQPETQGQNTVGAVASRQNV